MIKEIIKSKLRPHQSSGKFAISRVGSCWRKIYLIMKGEYEEEFDAKTLRAFEIGNLFHRQAVKELMEKSDKTNLKVVAVEVDVPEQEKISGRVDVIMSDSKTKEMFVVDIKSCTDWTLGQVRGGKCSKNYIYQIQLYLHFFGMKRGFILFFGKHRGEVEELEIIHDEELCLRLIKEVGDFFTNNVDKNIVPEKCDGEPWGCEVCEIKKPSSLNKRQWI